MSLNHPVFHQIEAYTAGLHHGVYFNMHRRSNRSKQVEHARVSLGVDAIAAGRLAFATWLAEMRILSDDPAEEPVPVAQARPHDLEAWWTLDDCVLEVRTNTGCRRPRAYDGAAARRAVDPLLRNTRACIYN